MPKIYTEITMSFDHSNFSIVPKRLAIHFERISESKYLIREQRFTDKNVEDIL